MPPSLLPSNENMSKLKFFVLVGDKVIIVILNRE